MKRVFVLEKEDIGAAIVEYVQKLIGENPKTDLGEYSVRFVPRADNGLLIYESALVERVENVQDY